MSTAKTWQTVSTGAEATLNIAEKIGRQLRGGEVVELISDLGGGKTTFVRGMAKGMGSQEMVHSPSFTLSNEYQAGNLTLYHFDFYRLNEPGVMRDELAEILANPQAVVAIEWAGIIEDVLPAERLSIHFKSTGATEREILMTYPSALSYLLNQEV